MNPTIIHKLLEEFISFHDHYTIRDSELCSVIRALADKNKWHFDNQTVWRKSAWNTTQEVLKRKEIERAERDRKIELRKALHFKLKEAIMVKLKASALNAAMMTERILTQKEIEVGAFFGVDISDCPDVGNHIIVIDNDFYKI